MLPKLFIRALGEVSAETNIDVVFFDVYVHDYPPIHGDSLIFILIKIWKIYFTLTIKNEMDANAFINGARDFIGTVLE